MLYWKTGNLLLRCLYPSRKWKVPGKEKKIYLTFDDGPHPVITPFVLDLLKQYHAHATFFCIGKNVQQFPDVYSRMLREGHAAGNHTMHHVNGWKTADDAYVNDVKAAGELIDSNLFRPPYGRMTSFQSALLRKIGYTPVMWSVLSGDFDIHLTPEACWRTVEKNTSRGSIVLFHDSEKAWDRLAFALPRFLEKFQREQYEFLPLETVSLV
ncbi:polysaccharide deacetylase family protein [Flavihumibacter petaseus]|uniref:Putative polysaccharide deacetylase n=1 Tax=Flavihumibacter petaseus NBRC 106054 TaxID=1220578 RepID=A0A0E9MX11_9BACT|nr:polysaccharide deacetylase family protein [Flavihumibacter petaseus]GAO41655.1 putative polysaccharide deacetylase [Flavihumibacter petaseus NBRC 106054]